MDFGLLRSGMPDIMDRVECMPDIMGRVECMPDIMDKVERLCSQERRK